MGLVVLGSASFGQGAFGYNDSGYCQHIRTIFGSESSKCNLGWYFSGWGENTAYPHYITITHTTDKDAAGSSKSGPYKVRMADNWTGHVTQTTRFGIPQDTEQFLRIARDFRSPERLITSTLRPAVTSSLDSVANLFTMEEYYAGGRRDDFKTEFYDAVVKGRAKIERIEGIQGSANLRINTAPNDLEEAQDTAQTGANETIRVVTKKKLGADGNPIRIENGFSDYGITVSTAIIQNLDPNDEFEKQIEERKSAAARRSVAKEKRFEEEEQRKLALAKAEKDIATKQGEARVHQIEQTTNAETKKRLVLINANQERDKARIALETAEIILKRDEVSAESTKVLAQAEAFKKQALLEADGALAPKLQTYKEVNQVWAQAFAKRQVPSTVIGSSGKGGTDSDVSDLMSLLTVKTAKDLQLDLSVGANQKPAAINQ